MASSSENSECSEAEDYESASCECCGLVEECSQEYLSQVKADFAGKWLCGLCTEAVKDEMNKWGTGAEEAMEAHKSFYINSRENPADRVVDGMKQLLRRRSSDMSAFTEALDSDSDSPSSSRES